MGGNFLDLRGARSALAGLDWTAREQPRDEEASEAATAKATSKRRCCMKTRWWRWACMAEQGSDHRGHPSVHSAGLVRRMVLPHALDVCKT